MFLYNHFTLYYGEELNHHLDKSGLIPAGISRQLFYHIGPRQYYKDFILDNIFTAKNISSDKNTTPSRQLSVHEVYSYVQNLKDSVEIWYQLLNPQDSGFSEEEKFWLEKLNRLDIFRVAPLLMVFFKLERSTKVRIRFLKAIERHLFVQVLMSNYRYDSDFERMDFGNISSQLMKDASNLEKAIRDIEQHVEELINKESFIASLTEEMKSRNHYTWTGIRYFLFEYEMELKSRSKTYRDRIENSDLYFSERREDYLTVEHIYPQRPGRRLCWSANFQLYNDREKSVLRNSLGNLVPLSKPKNSSLQNKCFDEKKGNSHDQVGFRYGSYSEIEVSGFKDWTAIEILMRGIKLLDFMERRWRLKFGTRQDKVLLLNLDFVLKKEGSKVSL